MADILPVEPLLAEIMEGETASVSFAPVLEADEIEVELKIIQTDFPESIDVSGPTFSGRFSGLFKLPPGSLKYRQGLEYGEADSFDSLPPKGTADLYSYKAPTEMIKNFKVIVSFDYMKGPAGAEELLNITKEYIQPVQGDWNTFKNQFLNYVR